MAALAKTNVAPVKWAQRKDSLYVTIDLPDVTGEDIKLTATKLVFSGKSKGADYAMDLEFLNEVDPETSTWKVLQRSVQMHVMKKDQDTDFWPRLLKDKNQEKTNVKVDWDKYVDEDEEKGGFDMSNLEGGSNFGGGMGGMGGMGGGGMDMEAMQRMMSGMGGGGMGGMGGMGDMGDFGGMGDEGDGDSDDEGLPDVDGVPDAPLPDLEDNSENVD
jgi:hypothetical protein